MNIYLWITFLLFSSNALAQELPANDSRLAIDPRNPQVASESDSVNLYVAQSGLERLAKLMDTDPEHISLVVDKAVDNMVVYGIAKIRQSGNEYAAGQFEQQYNSQIKNWFQRHYGLFDHEPWSQFLVSFYNALESILGHQACVMMHFDDLNEVNYAITVVFSPKDPRWDITNYRENFVPFMEAIAYWVSFAACEVITWGAGAITMVCTPIADMIEKISTCCVAPQISDSVYKRSNGL